MKTIIIVGGTREAAREKLQLMCNGAKIKELQWYDEAMLDGTRIWAMGGKAANICFLRDLGFRQIEKIIIVESDGISEEMGKHINYVRSTLEWQRRQECTEV